MHDIKWSKAEKKTTRKAFDDEWLTIDELKGLSEDKLNRINKLLDL